MVKQFLFIEGGENRAINNHVLGELDGCLKSGYEIIHKETVTTVVGQVITVFYLFKKDEK